MNEPFRYSYDAAGRLRGAIGPNLGSAAYAYDQAGNTTSITRTSQTSVGIIEFTPDTIVATGVFKP